MFHQSPFILFPHCLTKGVIHTIFSLERSMYIIIINICSFVFWSLSFGLLTQPLFNSLDQTTMAFVIRFVNL